MNVKFLALKKCYHFTRVCVFEGNSADIKMSQFLPSGQLRNESEKERVGRFGRMALKHVKYHV